MANIDKATRFWKTIREVSVKNISLEARRPISIIVVGDEETRREIIHQLTIDRSASNQSEKFVPVLSISSTHPDDGFPTNLLADTVIIDVGGGRSSVMTEAPIFALNEFGSWEKMLERIIDDRPELSLSLARSYPAFRPIVVDRIIRETALANAEFSMLNALPGVVPLVAPLLPATAIGDIFMLTKNQAMMLFRLAAAHDLSVDPRARSRELGPMLGNAFGWRAIAREVIGIVPGGFGLVARGAISYAGTIAVGKALDRFYDTGQLPDRTQINLYYKDAYAGAKKIVEERFDQLKRSRQRSRSRKIEFKKVSTEKRPVEALLVASEEDVFESE